MENTVALRPSYWASVSGGKDSLYMLYVILHNLDKYPLDGVVHYELEIDYPFIKDVVNFMEEECKKHGIPFYRFKPRKTWEELYHNGMNTEPGQTTQPYMFPSRKVRWCNSMYKMDAKRALDKFLRSKGFYAVHYIGYCADEIDRWSKRNKGVTEVYPLVEEGVNEDTIWEWAKNQPIFNDYYKFNRRCGCMYCPMASYDNLAYLKVYYPENFRYMMDKVKETERVKSEMLGKPFAIFQSNPKYNAEYIEHRIETKYEPELRKKLAEYYGGAR